MEKIHFDMQDNVSETLIIPLYFRAKSLPGQMRFWWILPRLNWSTGSILIIPASILVRMTRC